MKRTSLFLVTDEFPFGHGESFIESEIVYLSSAFNTKVITTSRSSLLTRHISSTIPVFRYSPPNESGRLFRYLIYLQCIIPFFLSSAGSQEIREILRGREKIIKRLTHSFVFFVASENFFKWLTISEIFKENTEGICYFYWNNYKVLSLARRKAKYPNLKIISRLHGYDLYRERVENGRQPFKRFMDASLDKVIFVSAYGMQYYFNAYGIHKGEKHLLCRLGTLNNFGMGPFEKTGVFDLVSCSNVVALKRINLIIDALMLVDEVNVHWQHFGDGDEMLAIKEYSNEMLGSKVNVRYTFHGAIDNQGVLKFYSENKVDCFITTSSTEGGNPVSIMEAMSFGIPIIATAVGGITEMLEDSGDFLLSSNPTPQEILHKIIHIFTMNVNDIEQLRKECRLLWETKYRASQNYKKFVEVLMNM